MKELNYAGREADLFENLLLKKTETVQKLIEKTKKGQLIWQFYPVSYPCVFVSSEKDLDTLTPGSLERKAACSGFADLHTAQSFSSVVVSSIFKTVGLPEDQECALTVVQMDEADYAGDLPDLLYAQIGLWEKDKSITASSRALKDAGFFGKKEIRLLRNSLFSSFALKKENEKEKISVFDKFRKKERGAEGTEGYTAFLQAMLYDSLKELVELTRFTL